MKILHASITVVLVFLFATTTHGDVLDISQGGADFPSGTINGAVFQVFDASTAGTGAINSFLRLNAQGNESTQKGYNTGLPRGTFPAGFPDFQQLTGNFTFNIRLGAIPKVTLNLQEFRAVLLDLNEAQNTPEITLERLMVFVGPNANQFIAGDESQLVDGGPFGTLVFDLDDPAGGVVPDNQVVMEDQFSGSGTSDVRILIPEDLFQGLGAAEFFTIFADFGEFDDGFEEFAVQGPGGGPGPGGDPTGFPVPEPTSLAIWSLLAILGIAVGRRIHRRN